MAEETKKRRGCGVGCLVIFLTLAGAFFLIVAAVVFFTANASGDGIEALRNFSHGTSSRRLGEDEMPSMREIWSSGSGTVKVARIRISGMIMLNNGNLRGPGDGSAGSALRAVRRATMDPEVVAILLEVDSPGGGITASDVLYNALRNFRRSREDRAIVAMLGDLAASGGYYVALAADRIVAHPTTVTGSIGVLMRSFNLRELADKIGIKDVTIKSGGNKDMFNPLRDLTPAQEALMQEVVDSLHARFVRLVSENRNLPQDKVRALADGRIFLAQQAQAEGLIDAIGYSADAEAEVAQLLGDASLRFIRYAEEPSLLDFLRGPRFFGLRDVRNQFLQNETRLLYLWPF